MSGGTSTSRRSPLIVRDRQASCAVSALRQWTSRVDMRDEGKTELQADVGVLLMFCTFSVKPNVKIMFSQRWHNRC